MKSRIWVLALLMIVAGCASQAEREADAGKLSKRVEIHTQLGALYLSRNQLGVAQQELEHALSLNSDDSQANNVMGLLQIRLKNDSKAERHFRSAISNQPDNAEARNNYGVFLCERARIDEADEQFLAAARNPLNKNPEQANVNAGICQTKKPDRQAANRYFRAALQHNPRQPIALFNLASLSFEAGEMLPARGFMQRYFEVAKDSPEALLLAFRIERALNAKDAQASYAVRLRGKFPDSPETRQLRTLTGK